MMMMMKAIVVVATLIVVAFGRVSQAESVYHHVKVASEPNASTVPTNTKLVSQQDHSSAHRVLVAPSRSTKFNVQPRLLSTPVDEKPSCPTSSTSRPSKALTPIITGAGLTSKAPTEDTVPLLNLTMEGSQSDTPTASPTSAAKESLPTAAAVSESSVPSLSPTSLTFTSSSDTPSKTPALAGSTATPSTSLSSSPHGSIPSTINSSNSSNNKATRAPFDLLIVETPAPSPEPTTLTSPADPTAAPVGDINSPTLETMTTAPSSASFGAQGTDPPTTTTVPLVFASPTLSPSPTLFPTVETTSTSFPTIEPTITSPTNDDDDDDDDESSAPTVAPTADGGTLAPTPAPTADQTLDPTTFPTLSPTVETMDPTARPTNAKRSPSHRHRPTHRPAMNRYPYSPLSPFHQQGQGFDNSPVTTEPVVMTTTNTTTTNTTTTNTTTTNTTTTNTTTTNTTTTNTTTTTTSTRKTTTHPSARPQTAPSTTGSPNSYHRGHGRPIYRRKHQRPRRFHWYRKWW